MMEATNNLKVMMDVTNNLKVMMEAGNGLNIMDRASVEATAIALECPQLSSSTITRSL